MPAGAVLEVPEAHMVRLRPPYRRGAAWRAARAAMPVPEIEVVSRAPTRLVNPALRALLDIGLRRSSTSPNIGAAETAASPTSHPVVQRRRGLIIIWAPLHPASAPRSNRREH